MAKETEWKIDKNVIREGVKAVFNNNLKGFYLVAEENTDDKILGGQLRVTFEWSDWKDLKPYRIGSVTGYNIGDEWKEAIAKYDLQVEEVKTDIFNMQKLLLGRIDLAVTDDEVMQRLIEMNPDSQVKLSRNKKPIFESVNNLGISKKSFLFPMLPRINEVLQEVKDDGTFQKIFCKHGKIYQASCESS